MIINLCHCRLPFFTISGTNRVPECRLRDVKIVDELAVECWYENNKHYISTTNITSQCNVACETYNFERIVSRSKLEIGSLVQSEKTLFESEIRREVKNKTSMIMRNTPEALDRLLKKLNTNSFGQWLTEFNIDLTSRLPYDIGYLPTSWERNSKNTKFSIIPLHKSFVTVRHTINISSPVRTISHSGKNMLKVN